MDTTCLEGPPAALAMDFDLNAAGRPQRAAAARAASGRRRRIDPTTCDREYSAAELEFMRAMDAYKRGSGRMFPTWSEVLEVLRSLGYRRVAEPTALPGRGSGVVAAPATTPPPAGAPAAKG